MKSTLLLFTAAVTFCTVISSCNRESNDAPGSGATTTVVPNTAITNNRARLVASEFSQPISLDTANKMIASYVSSVGYPARDTAVRSLAFNADTMRAYLSDSRITSLEFVLAHQLSYLNSGTNRFGKNIGMKPGALTIIAVGYDNNGNVIRNSSNGVYEHAMPCPNNCPNLQNPYLH